MIGEHPVSIGAIHLKPIEVEVVVGSPNKFVGVPGTVLELCYATLEGSEFPHSPTAIMRA